MASSSATSAEDAPSVRQTKAREEARLCPPDMKHNPPWRSVLLRYLKPGQSLNEIYRLLGWTKGRQYWARRGGGVDLRLSVASQMARAVRAPLGTFLAELATATGIPPLMAPPRRPVTKKSIQRKERHRKRCSYCQSWAHKRKDCPRLLSQSSTQLMLARGEAHAESGERLRKRR